MEPQANSAPTPENVPAPITPESSPVESVEAPAGQEVVGPKESANQNAGMPLPTVQQQPIVAPQKTTPTDDTATKDAPIAKDTPAVADDVDVIEREWVDKAKAIVDKTKEDPHKQNEEVSVLKADYMKKRYGKDIKLTKD